MRPTLRESLAAFVLGDRRTAGDAARQIANGLGWEAAYRLAIVWRVLPQVRKRARALGVSCELGPQLSRLAAANAAQAGLICHQSGAALEALSEAAIGAVVFKGVAAIATAYGSAAERMVTDCDVLIREGDLEPALRVLEAKGFRVESHGTLRAWRQLLAERAFPDHDFIEVSHPDGVTLDLHWRIHTPIAQTLDSDGILARAVPRKIGNRKLWVAAIPDLMLMTTQHSVREQLAPQVAVKDLLDLRAWIEGDVKGHAFAQAYRRASRCGLARALVAMALCLAHYDREGTAAKAARGVYRELAAPERRSAERLAEAFQFQVREGGVHKGLIGLSSPSIPTLKRYLKSRLRGLRDPDYRRTKFRHQHRRSLRAQAAQVIGDLRRLHWRKLRAYRAVARESRALSAMRMTLPIP